MNHMVHKGRLTRFIQHLLNATQMSFSDFINNFLKCQYYYGMFLQWPEKDQYEYILNLFGNSRHLNETVLIENCRCKCFVGFATRFQLGKKMRQLFWKLFCCC